MEDSKLYTAHDIEKLKQKVASYKDTLTSLKTGSSIDGYRFIKNEFNGFKSQISHLEGLAEIIDEKQRVQIGEYEQQVKQFLVQINSLNQTVEELNQDISLIRNKIKNDTSNIFKEHINTQVVVQESVIIGNNEKRVESFIEDITQTKDQPSMYSIQQSNRPPSYMQLQSLGAKATSIQEAPSDVAPISSLAIQKKYPEGQQYNKKIFPSTGVNPSQLYNGRNSNAPITSAVQLNKFMKKQRVPIRVLENSALSSATSVFEKNDNVTEHSDEMNNVAPIGVGNASIEISDEVNDVAPIEVGNSSIGISDEVNDVAPIEVGNASIESSDEVSDVAPIEGVNAPIESSDEVNDIALIEVGNAPIESSDEMNDIALIEVGNAPIECSDEMNDIALIEVGNAPIESSDEMNDIALIEMGNAPIESSDEMNDIALIEVGNAPIESSSELKRQQHKNKETFWLFNLFSKKH